MDSSTGGAEKRGGVQVDSTGGMDADKENNGWGGGGGDRRRQKLSKLKSSLSWTVRHSKTVKGVGRRNVAGKERGPSR